MTSLIKAALYILLSGWFLTAPVRAQEPRTTVREVATLAGIVDRVERTSRALTLRTANGVKEIVYVAPDVKVFDELKIGDQVTVRVVESVIVAMRPDLKPNVRRYDGGRQEGQRRGRAGRRAATAQSGCQHRECRSSHADSHVQEREQLAGDPSRRRPRSHPRIEAG